jgi:hypothetical protein
MSYIMVGKGKLDSISLPSNPHGHVGSMRLKATKQHPLGASHHRIFLLQWSLCWQLLLDSTRQLVLRTFSSFGCPGGGFNRSEISQHARVAQWKQLDC